MALYNNLDGSLKYAFTVGKNNPVTVENSSGVLNLKTADTTRMSFPIDGNVGIPDASYFYLRGNATTNGSVRFSSQSSGTVSYEQRVAGSWVAIQMGGIGGFEAKTSDYTANSDNSGKMWMRTDAATALAKAVILSNTSTYTVEQLALHNSAVTFSDVTTTSLTASQYVRTDSNKKLVTVSSIPATDITGLTSNDNFNYSIDGGGYVLTTGVKMGYYRIPIPRTITAVNMKFGDDATDSITIDILKVNGVANGSPASIVGSGTKPSISSAKGARFTDLSGWTTLALNTDDWLQFQIISAPATSTNICISIEC